jgi:6-phosphogluconolactonase
VFNYLKHGQLEFVQHMSALPPDYSGPADGADIHVSPDGKFLYSSTRGQSNNIAIFSINPASGMIVYVGHQSTLGKTPRNFNFDPTGNFLLAANQNSEEIVIFKRDKTTGLLQDSGGRIAVGKPVCIQWVTAK